MKMVPRFISHVTTSIFVAGIASAVSGAAYAQTATGSTPGSSMSSTTTSGPSTSGNATSGSHMSNTRAAKIAEKDFGRVSNDGVRAFDDVHLARIALFDGKTDEAAKFIADAQSSLAKAKVDDAVFMKAESDFHVPANMAATGKTPTDRTTQSSTIAWIPIDSDIAFGEIFQATSGKGAAIATAKKALAKGDSTNALKAIKLADIVVDYTLAVAPLEHSISAVNEASTQIASKDYYAASQSLKQAEDGIRFDEYDDVASVGQKPPVAVAKLK